MAEKRNGWSVGMKVRVFSENGWTKGVIIKRRSDLYEWMTEFGWGCHRQLGDARTSVYRSLGEARLANGGAEVGRG